MRHGGIVRQSLGQAEVRHVRPARVVDEDVGRLEVAVEHAPSVGRLHRVGHLGQQPGPLAGRDAALCQPPGEGRAVDQPHAVEGMSAAFAHLEDRDDARMVEVRGGLGLAAKPRQVGRTGQVPPEEHLDRHGSSQAPLQGPVDDAHAAAADLLEQLVVAQRHRQRRDARNKTAVRMPTGRHHDPRRRAADPGGPVGLRSPVDDRRFPGHRIGHEHRREEFPQLAGQIGMGRGRRFQPRLRRIPPPFRQLVDERCQPLLLLHGERGIDRPGAANRTERGRGQGEPPKPMIGRTIRSATTPVRPVPGRRSAFPGRLPGLLDLDRIEPAVQQHPQPPHRPQIPHPGGGLAQPEDVGGFGR